MARNEHERLPSCPFATWIRPGSGASSGCLAAGPTAHGKAGGRAGQLGPVHHRGRHLLGAGAGRPWPAFLRSRRPEGHSAQGYCDLPHTLQMAKRIKDAGMGFLLDFHYSDTWADPGKQFKPAAWADLHGADLEKAVYDHTRQVMSALKQQGAPPDMVQIGNEISNGMLWPDGQVWRSGRWDTFCGLVKAGIRGVADVSPSTKTMLHLACGGQNAQSRAFLDKVAAQDVKFDVIGQSYYPRWHGTLVELKANLADLAARYPQDIAVVEYSVPKVQEINDIVREVPNGKGLGTFIWEPTGWAGPALFDREGNTKPEMDVYPTLRR
ncbi:MAG: glycoside hydrolase family 53 protein [Pirellulales bacterium]